MTRSHLEPRSGGDTACSVASRGAVDRDGLRSSPPPQRRSVEEESGGAARGAGGGGARGTMPQEPVPLVRLEAAARASVVDGLPNWRSRQTRPGVRSPHSSSSSWRRGEGGGGAAGGLGCVGGALRRQRQDPPLEPMLQRDLLPS